MFEKSDGFNQILTEYAQNAYLNPEEEVDLSRLFFPSLKVGAVTGRFDKYAFEAALTAVDTTLARDNSARRLQLDKTPDYWDCQPQGLEISAWKPSLLQDDARLIREDNLRTLMSAQFVSRQKTAVDAVKNGLTDHADLGGWKTDKTRDIIQDVEALCNSVVNGTGRKPNTLVMGHSAWASIRNADQFVNRISGLSFELTSQAFLDAISYKGLRLVIADSMAMIDGKMTELLANDVIALYNEESPTRSDLSFGKEFTLSPNGPEVISYEEHGLNIVDTLMWSSDRKITNSAAAARLVIS